MKNIDNGKIIPKFRNYVLLDDGIHIDGEKNPLSIEECIKNIFEYGSLILNDDSLVLPLGSLVYRRLDNSLLDRLDSISKQGRAYSVNIKNIDISKNETKRIDIPMEMIDYYKDTGEFLIKRPMLVYLSDDYDATSDNDNGSITNEIIDFQNILKSYNLPVIFITRDLEFKSIIYSSIVRYLDVD